MYKKLLVLLPLLLFSFLEVSAEEIIKINARVLPTVWYSTLSAKEGDIIKIYAGIQNNSDINFEGTASFLVNGEEIRSSSFVSGIDTLKYVSAEWVAKAGKHNIQVKAKVSLKEDQSLVSYESEVSNIDIAKKVVPISKKEIEAVVFNSALNIVSNVDSAAESLAAKIESLKTPDNIAGLLPEGRQTNNGSIEDENVSSVLGASSGPDEEPTVVKKSPLDFVRNISLSVLSFFVINWKWSLFGIFVALLFWRINKRKKGNRY